VTDAVRARVRVGRWALVTLLATVLLIGVGGYTRGSGSGYGCEDRWPLCERGYLGGLLPRAEREMVIEWSHRWLAAVVGLLALATAVSAVRHVRRNRAIAVPAVAAVGVIGIQAWVGRLIVTNDLDADLVSLHLAISLTVAALLTVTATIALAGDPPGPGVGRLRLPMVGATGIVVAVVIVLGSLVHNRYYPGWPLLEGALVPDPADGYRFLHFLHRGIAGVGIVLLAWIVVDAYRRRVPTLDRRLSLLAAGCYGINVVLGLVHVLTQVQRGEVVAVHLVCAAGAWVALVALVTRLAAAGARDGSGAAQHVDDAHRADADHVGQPDLGAGMLP
jgi:cytochrome c oxidase assembly protein subunit 15